MYLLVYVDDIIITGDKFEEIDEFVKQLQTEFSLKDMGELHYFLGVKVTRTSTGSLRLCQCKYVMDLLDRCDLASAKGVHTPMVSSPMLSKHDGALVDDPTEYRSITGALQYVVL